MDNTDAGASTVGTWTASTAMAGYNGVNYVTRPAGTGANSFTWAAAVPAAGRYKVYAKWMGNAVLSSNAKYTVHHAGGTTLVTKDQTVNKVMWNLLGSYELDPSPALGHKVVLSDDANGNTVADAVRFVPVVGLPLVQADAVKIVPNSAEEALYVHTDHLGAPRKMSDPAGAVVWDAALTPFGLEDSIAGTEILEARFPGQWHDAESGLRYNYFRDYDPSLGRYLQSDPIGLAGGLNTYAYVGGNPANFVDPTGEIILDPGVNRRLSDFLNGSLGSPPPSLYCGPDLDDEQRDQCERQYYDVDIPTCNGISQSRGPAAGARCFKSAAERYAACIGGRPLPPLDTYNN